jgi:hypothetical protein
MLRDQDELKLDYEDKEDDEDEVRTQQGTKIPEKSPFRASRSASTTAFHAL